MSESNEEIQRLRDKAATLLDEKKQMQAQRDELAAQVETLTAERDSALSDLRRVTVEQPRREVIDAVAATPAHAGAVEREIMQHVTVADDGSFLDKDGEPLTGTDGEPLTFSEAGIHALADDAVPVLRSLIKPRGLASGGGAPGSTGCRPAQPDKTPRADRPTQAFGLK